MRSRKSLHLLKISPLENIASLSNIPSVFVKIGIVLLSCELSLNNA